jgi:hypothetical protein
MFPAESDDEVESEELEVGDDFPVRATTSSDMAGESDLRAAVVAGGRSARWLVDGCWNNILLCVTVFVEVVRDSGGILPILGVLGLLVSPFGVGLSL